MSDMITLRGMSVWGVHGLNDIERQEEQEFNFDIEVRADLSEAAGSDSIDDTIDYMELIDRVEQIVGSESFYLLEALGQRLAESILEFPIAQSVRVVIRKPGVAIELGLEAAEIQIERSR
ncbi:MAG: dihydroneopterin aldolase [Actinomycetota bacterium]